MITEMDLERFATFSLKDPRALRILSAGLDAADPKGAVERHLADHPLPRVKHTYALAIGKAAPAMMEGLAASIPISWREALLITKPAPRLIMEGFPTMLSAHPVPDETSVQAGEAALRFAGRLEPGDLLVCLISGGGSSLVTAPRIPLEQLQDLTRELLTSGARIHEINTLRRHLDRVKGGGLARAANGARVVSLILSDVVGDPLEAIASGPTAPDPTTLRDVDEVIRRYGLEARMPAWVVQALRETSKPGDSIFERVDNRIIANNESALQAARKQAEREGFSAQVLTTALQGEASQAGIKLAAQLRSKTENRSGPICLLAGGETTVTVRGYGVGGRNQELALGAMPELAGLRESMLISIATDGEDGPSGAAGAVVTGQSWGRASSLGIDVNAALERNDSGPVFRALHDQIDTGPTGTNVNDLVLMFRF